MRKSTVRGGQVNEWENDSRADESCNKSDDEDSLCSFIVQDEDDSSYSDNDCDNAENDEGGHIDISVDNLERRKEADCPFELVSGLDSHGYATKSFCPIYKVDDGRRLEAVPLPDLYRYRGKELSKLSRYEYRTQVKVEQKSKDDEEEMDGQNKPKRGRQKSKSFEFAKGFALHASHIQKLRMKLCTLKLYGNPPPFPGEQPEDIKSIAYKKWRKKADRFGAYFLALFRPEEHLYEKDQVNDYIYNWEAFIQFQNDLKNGSYIERMRFRTMEGYMFAWRSNARDRTILSNYRERNRTIWSKTERDSAISAYGNGRTSQRMKSFFGDDDSDETKLFDYMQLSPGKELRIMRDVSFSDDLGNTLRNVIVNFPSSHHQSTPNHQGMNFSVKTCPPNPRFAEEILDNDATTDDTDDTDSLGNTHALINNYNHHEETVEFKIEAFLVSMQLSEDKALAMSVMKDHFYTLAQGVPDDYVAPILLITGGPGVGKSFLVDAFDGVAKIIDAGDQLRMALFGSAAVNIDGSSLMALMDIPRENKSGQQKVKPWDDKKLMKLKRLFDLNRISTIIIDEISTVKSYMLGYLNNRLQVACGNDKPFGGKAIVFLGDFDQLPPTGGMSIPECAMYIEEEKYIPLIKRKMSRVPASKKKDLEITSITRQGVRQFVGATHINLTEQHRSEDQEHTDLLNKMSAGESIGPEDLKNYKTLSAEDTSFEFATILTPGHKERHEFNNIQARRWARKHQTQVVRWPRRERNWRGKPTNPFNVHRVKEMECCFWELFVPGAFGYLTFNFSVDKGLANGTEIKYDSMSFLEKEDQKTFENLQLGAAPGDVITLKGPPDFINVELFADLIDHDERTKQKNELKRRSWKYGSLTNDGRIVIPISVKNIGYAVEFKSNNIRGCGGYQIRPSSVELADYFPIELGFSVTIHKAQVSDIRISSHMCVTIVYPCLCIGISLKFY